ncbi:NACHT, LRR and PYD domains-containing protein 6-like isoform X2 [Siniperca chuatsi]|uniref:NACHT, LRR and PYD domains-containing protein 6-like isoform X2 n=1 Tax=Siniperca chuatsi TaxID=119488 RepID=UPI001CE1AD0B|nr:NACHT, LRR and PYD domains-containing protein 6-like isoform X2 [Siniperca chuatsi]
MMVSEEGEDGVSTPEVTLSEKHDSQIRAKSLVNQERPDSSVPSCVSMRTERSKNEPIEFKDEGPIVKPSLVNQERPDSSVPSCLSMNSDQSKGEPMVFKDGGHSDKQSLVNQERPDTSVPSCVSMRTERSKNEPIEFKDEGPIVKPSPVNQQRPDSSVPSCLSMNSDQSKGEPMVFKDGGHSDKQSLVNQERPDTSVPSCVSMRTDRSKNEPIEFKDEGPIVKPSPVNKERPDSSVPSCLSMNSDQSKGEPMVFKDGGHSDKQSLVNLQRPDPAGPSCVSMRTDRSKSEPIEFKDEGPIVKPRGHRKRLYVLSDRPAQKHQTNLDSIFMLLEENIVTFVKNELKTFKKVLGAEYPECSVRLREDDEVRGGEEGQQRSSNRDAFLRITLNFLKRLKQEQLADALQSKTLATICQHKLKSNLKKKFQCLFEGTAKAGNPTLLNRIFTELHITEEESREVNDQHEVRQIESALQKPASSETAIRCDDMFKPLSERDEPVRTLVTKGVAGIGKTVLTQKYILDWAEDKANHNIQFIFPFTFRELNLLTAKNYSLVELLHYVFTETKEAGICRFEEFQVVFIFDGLDECRFPLDFHNNKILTDVTESTSVDVLLTNLIRGKLLPSARLWITTRPAAANQIPPECIDMVTEVRGFSDPQKEEYFRKRFGDEEQGSRIISHIETSRSLHIMCHIPVFCWITATVLAHVLKTRERAELPKTLTEMYIHFLVVQTKQGNVKYHSSAATDPVWNKETKKIIQSLGKLAFEQLEKGILIFYEADLRECGIDLKAASVYSGLFTEIFKDEHGLNQDKVFCFVHLSIQEFLAALYVFLTFINTGVNLLRRRRHASVQPMPPRRKSNLKHLYQCAVDEALQSSNGHLDLFVRFLLGLSLETNQMLLRGLLKMTGNKPQVKKMLVQYIKCKVRDNPSPERSINLFHCLNELNDRSLVEEIQQYLRSGRVFGNKLSPSQWSALVFILLSSQKDLDEFDLKKFSASEEGLLWLLPVVKASKTSLLSGCNLSLRSCEALVSVFTSKNSSLRELDLSNNDLHDKGVELLSDGLKSPHCRLEILRLSGCLVTEKGCDFLASALNSNPSHLRELDLRFNHPGDSGVKLLSAGLDGPHWKLETLKIDHCGKCRLKPSPLRYFCELPLDPNTADRNLSLSDDNRRVMVVKEKQPYPDHPERFDSWKQLLCSEGLTGRCYWEVRWEGRVNVGVTYRGIKRRGDSDDCCIGWNDQSWSLICSAQGYTAWHNNIPTDIGTLPPSDSNRLAVYVDWPAGTVSFYCLPSIVSSVKRIHLHTFHSTFTEPLYPAFGFGRMLEFGTDSRWLPPSLCLSQIEE